MERLTIPDVRVDEHTTRRSVIDVAAVREHAMEFYCRLKAYEDTGLTPEEVTAAKLALMGKTLAEITEFEGVPIDRLRELAEADKDGRCVVLPCKPGDMLYEVTNRKTISEYRVTAICVTLGGLFLEWEIKRGFAGRSAIGIIPDWIGKTVFLTREEAEKTMEGMENGNKTSL